jgi:hypothetical protein
MFNGRVGISVRVMGSVSLRVMCWVRAKTSVGVFSI